MSMKLKIEGAGDIERALAELARGTAKGATRRAMKKVLKPVQEDGSHSPHAHLYEFGTAPRFHAKTGKAVGSMPARPFLRPAWDASQELMLATLRREIWSEIEKTVGRARRKAARAGK